VAGSVSARPCVLDQRLLQRVRLGLVHHDPDRVGGDARRRGPAVVGPLLERFDARRRVADRDHHPPGVGVAALAEVDVLAGLLGLLERERQAVGRTGAVGLDVGRVVVVPAAAEEHDGADDDRQHGRERTVPAEHPCAAAAFGHGTS
jgi:hypothetical protein